MTSDLTEDTLFQGKLICRQHRQGYRFSVDAVLAAHFPAPASGHRILDLGSGCGVIGLILAHRQPGVAVTCLEVQQQLADLAEDNGNSNGFSQRFKVVRGDVTHISGLLAPESFDLVVCNPPYRKKESGRVNQDDQAASARHEFEVDIGAFVRAAAFCVKNRGRVVFVYPARRCTVLLTALQANRLTLKRLQPVYSYPDAAGATLICVEAMKNGGEQCEILAPLYIYERKNGGYSADMLAMYR